VLVYVQKSQPTTCFGFFQLGHLQVGHKGHRNYIKKAILALKPGGRDFFYKVWGICADWLYWNVCIVVSSLW